MLRLKILITVIVTLGVIASVAFPIGIDRYFRSNACDGHVTPDKPRGDRKALGPLDSVTREELCREFGVPSKIRVRDGRQSWTYGSQTFSHVES